MAVATELALSTDINVITAEINAYKRVAGEAIFEIGRRLKHVKENDLAHGHWERWCRENINMTPQYANRFIIVLDRLGNRKTSFDSIASVDILYLISSLPPEERERPHTVPSTGETKTVDEMTVRELREVKKALQAERAAREKAEADYEVIRDTLESVQGQSPKVEYVRDTSAEERLRRYEEKFGDIENYTDRYTATNSQELTTSIMSFSKAVRDLAKRHAYLIQYQHVISTLDEITRSEYNEATQALRDLADDFNCVDKGRSVIDAEFIIR